jgi:putative flippase GtrA
VLNEVDQSQVAPALMQPLAGQRIPQPVRFLLAGGFNTAWGYGSFALLYFLLSPCLHYFVILTLANIINITVSFGTYKFFVFRTRGGYLREYFRFYAVNAVPIIMGYVLFPLLKDALRLNPYLAQAIILVITVIVSYFGHKHISFARPRPDADPQA